MKNLLLMAFFLACGTIGLSQDITAYVPSELKGGEDLILNLTTAEQVVGTNQSSSGSRRAGPSSNSTHWLITKDVDSTSPTIESATSKGRVWKRVIIKIETANNSVKYDLENCYLSSYSVSAGPNGAVETFKIHYQYSSSTIGN